MADAFERLFLAEYPRVVAIAARIVRERAGAEDVAQEVFLDFHRRHPAQADYAAAWLHRAAAHAALNSVRSRRRREDRERRSEPPAAAAGADEIALQAEEHRQVRAALGRMPRRYAALLALRASGLTYAETAAALGVGVSSIGTMLRRAEARLLKEVSE